MISSPEEVILDSSENTSSQIEPVTWESFGNKIRRFNYDIMPKVILHFVNNYNY